MSHRQISTTALAAVLLSLAVPAFADRQAVVDGKGHFDPHNHDTGILPYYAYAGLNSFIKNGGGEASVGAEQRVELFAHMLAVHLLDYPNMGGKDRMSGASYATLECAAHKLKLGKIKEGETVAGLRTSIVADHKAQLGKALLPMVNDTLLRLLSSSPWTAFDSAHAYRGDPVETFLSNKHKGEEGGLLAHATILHLAKTGVQYVELSKNFIGGPGKGDKRVVEMERWNDILTRLRGAVAKDDTDNLTDLRRHIGNGPIPSISWLLMLHTTDLSRNAGEDMALTFDSKDGSCQPTMALLKTQSAELDATLSKDYVGGVDFAAPEKTCFSDKGMAHYEAILKAVLAAAGARNRKLVVRTHVGEGFVLLTDEAKFRAAKGEAACKVFDKYPGERRGAEKTPLHYAKANANMTKLITKIKALRVKQSAQFDKHLVLRLGHVTHVDSKQAAAMKANNIWADINLTSNISTRSWELTASNLQFLESLRSQPNGKIPNRVRAALLDDKLIRAYREHALKTLLSGGVKTVLGTDGGGIEHSNINDEHALAVSLIKYWNAGGAALRVDALVGSEKEHVQQWPLTSQTTVPKGDVKPASPKPSVKKRN